MNCTYWKNVLVWSIALCLDTTDPLDLGHVKAMGVPPSESRGEQRDGRERDAPQSNRVFRPQSGSGARSRPERSGDGPYYGRQGGIRSPAVGGQRQSVGGSQPVGGSRQPFNDRMPAGRNSQQLRDMRRGDPGVPHDSSFRPQVGRHYRNRSTTGNQPLAGNIVNYNNRSFRIGHSAYQPAYYRHSGYHGHWNGNRGDHGNSAMGYGSDARYGYRPVGWGLGGWGLGSLIYNSGYLGYWNPYFAQLGSPGYNYSQQSAATIHAVLAVGPGWDWSTLRGMYSRVAIYTDQLRRLETYTKTNPQDAASRFLLAYHYMSCGHAQAAARHLQQVVALMPNDHVAAEVLKMVNASGASELYEVAQLPPRPDAARPTMAPIIPATLVGTWTAARADGATFDLTLTSNDKFNWKFAAKEEGEQEFSGTYTLEGNVLALERKDGGTLIAVITPGDNDSFNFKLMGASEDDRGLNFQR